MLPVSSDPVLDRDSCCRALDARDPRFDGVFFVGVTTTGVYCRPICPARRSDRNRCLFFTTAAAAEQAGFRPCLRCRPELAPGRARVDAVPRLAQAAALRIAAGALNGCGVEALASSLGVSGRQLRRALKHELGVSPVELAQTHRLLLAKYLLADTDMTLARVAFTSGFQSLRRFNALFQERYRLNPGALRRGRSRPHRSGAPIHLRLAYRPPLAWPPLLGTLRTQAVPGVEYADQESYCRTVRLDGRTGTICLRAVGPATRATGPRAAPVLELEVSESLLPVVMALLPRVRLLLDLNAEPETIDAHLRNAGLYSLAPRRPGLRVAGAFDGFESALRALVSLGGGASEAVGRLERLAGRFGEAIRTDHPMLTRLTPTPDRLANADVSEIVSAGLPRADAVRFSLSAAWWPMDRSAWERMQISPR